MFSYVLDPHFTMESRALSSHFDFSTSSSSSSPFISFSPLVFNQDNTFHDLFINNPQLGGGGETQTPLTTPIAPLPPIKELAPSPNKKGNAMNRKRETRKDRHSKIVTTQGSRGRRMRLNLEVAPQFFDIQDMLGYDKASKTVQWLMKEAEASIDHLRATTRPPKAHSMSGGGSSKSTEASSELECEDISTISNLYKGKTAASKQVNINTAKAKRGYRHPSTSRRASYPSSLAKESRAMARARARERTIEKKNCNLLFSSSIPFEAIDEEYSGSHDLKSSLEIVAEVEEKYSPSANQSTQVNDGERENELSVSILDYDNNVCSHDTANFFPSEQWVSTFGSVEDDQIETRLWG